MADEDTDESITVKILRIERYVPDSLSILKSEMAGVCDLHDITVTSKSKKMRCIIHPSLNYMVYRGLIQPKTVISINAYKTIKSDDYDVRILTDLTALTDESSDSLSNSDDFFDASYKTLGPLTTNRDYYLPLYNNEDCYGNIWKKFQKKMTLYEPSAFKDLIDLSQLDVHRRSGFPVYGTVITKSRLSHFGKPTDNKNNSPFVFSIELEGSGKTCSVTFWNKACLAYYHIISIGQVLVLKNYRVKRRYGNRTNTVYSTTDPILIELSINSEKATGEVNLLDEKPCFIEYRFYTAAMLEDNIFEKDFILDVTGIVSYLGRWEREKKKATIWSQQPLTTTDFWMYRWIMLYDGTSKEPVLKIKLYACAQNEVTDKLELGDILVASRMLCKCEVAYTNGQFHRYMYLTSSRETQLYRIKDPYDIKQIEKFPFATCEIFLNILKNFDIYMQKDVVRNEFQYKGYFKFPPIPTSLAFYRCSFEQEAPFRLLSVKGVKDLMTRMHMYESARANIKGSIFIEELIKDRAYVNGSYVWGTIVIDQSITDKYAKKRNKPANVMTLEKIQNYLGVRPYSNELREFMRVGLVDMVYQDYLEIIFSQTLAHDFVENHEKITSKDMFLFVLDIYCYGDNQFEVVANRYFYLDNVDL